MLHALHYQQLPLIALLTREPSYYENSSLVVLTHFQFHRADSPWNIVSTFSAVISNFVVVVGVGVGETYRSIPIAT
jgi:hypothetical protein